MSATITWLGHATFKLVLPDERVVLIDPWIAENPACPDNAKKQSRCDVILLTHGHFDHVADVKDLVQRFDPLVIGTFELCSVLEQQIGKGRFSGMNTGGTQDVDGLRVSLTPALHSSSVTQGDGPPIYAGMPNGVVVSTDGVATLYHAGDTDVFGDMKLIAQMYAPQVCILPIGDHFTMGAKGAALAAEMLGNMSSAFEMTLEYLKTRRQFGVVIGTFQGLKHRAALIFIEIELARSAVLGACEALDTGSDIARSLVSVAKVRCSDAAMLVAYEGVQMHGGIGMTDEHDIGLYLKRARGSEIAFGDAAFHRDRFAGLNGF